MFGVLVLAIKGWYEYYQSYKERRRFLGFKVGKTYVAKMKDDLSGDHFIFKLDFYYEHKVQYINPSRNYFSGLRGS